MDEAVALADAVDALLDAELSRLGDLEVTSLLTEVEVQKRRLAALDHRLLAEAEERRLAGAYGRSSVAELLVSLLRITPAEARARVAQARDLGPRRELTGASLPPLLPATADATAEGAISTAHTAVIIKAVDVIPAELAVEASRVVEQVLVDQARREHPGHVQRTAQLLLARLDQDGPEPSDAEIEARRDFTLRPYRGGAVPHGWFAPELAAGLQAVLDSLAAPRPGTDGEPDPRSAGQRRHDGLQELVERVLRSGTLPASGGTPATVLVTATVADLLEARAAAHNGSGAHGDRPVGPGVGVTAHGELIRLDRLLAQGETELIGVLFDQDGAVLRLGRRLRLASCPQRLALTARDGGCCFPGCDRPASWCQVHHVVEWQAGGSTDIDNMCLLCSFHHREFERRGWQVRMAAGMPEWIPPPWLDPDQRPIRNTAHHLPEIIFDVAGVRVPTSSSRPEPRPDG